jgi:hypothetical protein
MPGGRRRGVPRSALLFAPHGYNNPSRYTDPSGHLACSKSIIVDDQVMCLDSPAGISRYTPTATTTTTTRTTSLTNALTTCTSRSSASSGTTSLIPIDPTVSSHQSPDNNPPPPDTTRQVMGTILGGALLISGIVIAVVGIGLTPEDPPAGLFIAGAGSLLAVMGAEILYHTWRKPDWPKFLIINYP